MKKPIAFCFDLDGTVTSQEILPLISSQLDIFEEINLLTNLTLSGQIPFKSSFKLRVRMLAAIPISEVKAIVEKVIIDPNIQAFIQDNSDDCYIVTGNLDVWVVDLIRNSLQCQFFSSTAVTEGDRLIKVDKTLNKRDAITALRPSYDKIVSIGDSMNDCSMFEVADMGIAYGGVHAPVDSLIKLSQYVVNDSHSLVQLLNTVKRATCK